MSRPRRHSVVLALVGWLLLTGCSDGPVDEEGGPGGGDGTRSRAERLEGLAPVPEVRRAGPVARRYRFLGSVRHEAGATPAEVRRAAELEQVAARTLARAPRSRARAVQRRLPAPLRGRVRDDVAAARRLGALVSRQKELPEWRVVRPPRPQRLLAAYRAAERGTGVGWEYLAAIHLVETRMGRIRGVSTAGAQGPMQFIPTTWDIYGAGGDINDPEDAIMAAGRLLRANGAATDMADALWHYNQSGAYVFAVQSYARVMRRQPGAYHRYWHWRVLYRYTAGTQVLPVGYPGNPAVDLEAS